MNMRSWLAIGLTMVAIASVVLIASAPAHAGKLEEAIAKTPQGTESGMIDPSAPKGFMGIQGSPKPFILWGVLWGVWVGWIFSSVGAFGGIMAGVGHISVFGLGDYAATFKKTNPALGKMLTDSIRASNQYLVGLSGLISSATYYRMGRLVLPLAISLGVGAVLGAILVPYLTAGKVDLKAYVGYFGVTVLIIGAFLFYETTPRGQKSKKAAKEAAAAFEREHMSKGAVASTNQAQGVQVISFSAGKVRFSFYGVEFSFNPIVPAIGGFVISAISSFIGVGGGFLYVPFLTSIAGLPMYIVAGTSALAVLISMVVSIGGYMIQGTPIDFAFVGVEMIGIFIGSILGPITSKKIPDIWLKRIFVVLAIYIGLGYVLKGFFALKLPGL
jgi:uncharacterized membrane protein YfcA